MAHQVDRIAVYPGTFDPITYGHLDVIKRAALIFDRLVIAVAIDTNKTVEFSVQERVALIEQEVARMNIANIEVTAFSGLLVNFVSVYGANIIVRGLRALSDFEYEFQMAYMNYKLNAKIETVFLPATEHGHYISSSFVKQIAKLDGDLSGFVSAEIAAVLRKRYGK